MTQSIIPVRKSKFQLLAAALVLGLISGCGGATPENPTGELKGLIALDGESIKLGTIRVVNENGDSAQGIVTPGGKYLVENVPLGKVKLIFVPPPTMNMDQKEIPPDAEATSGPPKKERKQKIQEALKTLAKIPARYLDPAQTELATTISEGSNQYDIKMKSRRD